jgi:biotin carboxyl carrier protein
MITINRYELPVAGKAVETVIFDGPAHIGFFYEGAIDFGVPAGTRVYAPLDGTVTSVRNGQQKYGPSRTHADKANYVQIEHAAGERSSLVHLEAGSALVKEGDRVKQGQAVTRTGLSGRMTDPHLRWGISGNNGSEASLVTLQIRLGKAAAELVLKKERVVIPTARHSLTLRQLALPSDDMAYYKAVWENTGHVDNYGNDVSSKYRTVGDVRQARLETGEGLRMGIWDGQRFVGHGYATLAVNALVGYVESRFSRVFAEVHPDNSKSAAVLVRAGFHETGEAERDWGPAVIFEFTKSRPN